MPGDSNMCQALSNIFRVPEFSYLGRVVGIAEKRDDGHRDDSTIVDIDGDDCDNSNDSKNMDDEIANMR